MVVMQILVRGRSRRASLNVIGSLLLVPMKRVVVGRGRRGRGRWSIEGLRFSRFRGFAERRMVELLLLWLPTLFDRLWDGGLCDFCVDIVVSFDRAR